MTKCKKNETVKAFNLFLTNSEKIAKKNGDFKTAEMFRLMRRLTGQANNRGESVTIDDINDLCKGYKIGGHGASKQVFIHDDLCIARVYSASTWDINQNVDQILNQIDFWNKIADTDDAVYFNPMITYGTHRGDKVGKGDKRTASVTYCISQRCMVRESGDMRSFYEQKTGRNFDNDYRATAEAGRRHGLHDEHGGNFGIMYNHALHTYRIVWIDYGL